MPSSHNYLLDVNALLALGYFHHEFHDRVARWIEAEKFPPLLTCSITELGFVRLLSQPVYGFSVAEAQTLLLETKRNSPPPFSFLSDAHDVSFLPKWVKTSKQTTDGHLLELARAHGVLLATLDEKIPGAYIIPHTSK